MLQRKRFLFFLLAIINFYKDAHADAGMAQCVSAHVNQAYEKYSCGACCTVRPCVIFIFPIGAVSKRGLMNFKEVYIS